MSARHKKRKKEGKGKHAHAAIVPVHDHAPVKRSSDKKDHRAPNHKGDVQRIKAMMRNMLQSPFLIYGVIFIVAVCASGIGGMYYYRVHQKTITYERVLQSQQHEKLMAQFEEDNVREIGVIQDHVSTDDWKVFHSQWYGFEMMYPQEGWTVQTHKVDPMQTKAVYQVDFLKHDEVYNEPVGFSVSVYDAAKVTDLAQTDEFPLMKSNDLAAAGLCATPTGHMFETGDYPAEELYVPLTDECYESALFFTITKGQYIYNIAPILYASAQEGGHDPMVAATDIVPEYFAAIARFSNIDIVRPKPQARVVRYNAPMPASFKRDALGRFVCGKKSDRPSKSKDNNKGKTHMDMECCLDPDEFPNPHCYYDTGKYGKFLDPSHQEQLRTGKK